MTRYRARLAYDGTAYHGFQRQAGGLPTVQGAVEAALLAVTGQPATVLGAGRTDAGVHASGQVIAFALEWGRGTPLLLKALNAVLPPDIALQDLSEAAPDFHPRFSAWSRRYRYDVVISAQRQPLWRRVAWQLQRPLAWQAAQAAAALLIGRHDFATFGDAPHGENTTREVHRSLWTLDEQAGCVVASYHIEANAFLKHMVRRIVWMLVEVGRGRHTPETFGQALRAANLKEAGKIAPPQGLHLVEVRYCAPTTHDNETEGDAQAHTPEVENDESKYSENL